MFTIAPFPLPCVSAISFETWTDCVGFFHTLKVHPKSIKKRLRLESPLQKNGRDLFLQTWNDINMIIDLA